MSSLTHCWVHSGQWLTLQGAQTHAGCRAVSSSRGFTELSIQLTFRMCLWCSTGWRECSVPQEALWEFDNAYKTSVGVFSCFRGHSNAISDCCFTSDGRYLCTASWDRSLKIWDVKTGEFRSRGPVTLNQGHEGSVSSCCFSQDGELSWYQHTM